MAPAAQTLFGLFGDFTAGWPSAAIREHTGNVVAGDEPDPSAWLGALNNSVQVTSVRGGARPDGVALEAELTVGTGGFLGYPGGWPFVFIAMPDVEFRIQPFLASGRTVRLFAALGQDGGPEVVLEGLPVEIRLPPELVEVHPDEPGDPAGNATVEVGEFEAGRLDDLKVIYRRGDSTSILVHVRLTVTGDLQFDVQPAVPVSFGRCGLSGIPCTAVHDFRLIPSPRLARDRQEWLRHGIEPWLPSHAASNDGLFAIRSVDVDGKSGSVKDLVGWLNDHEDDREPTAEFVLGDAVVPFRGPFFLPVPRHLTAGVRRNVLDPGSKQEVFVFERAPVHTHISKDPPLAFIVESLYYRSLPSGTLDQDLGLTFHAAIVRGKDGTAQRAYEIGLEEDYTLTVAYKRDFTTPPTGPPVPGPGPDPDTNRLVHWEIAQLLIVDVMAIRAGLSLGRLIGEGRPFRDSAILTVDLFVSMPPTGKDDHSGFRLRALNGEKAAFALENVGWRLGSVHLEGVALPDGVVAYLGPLGFVISELGLIAEDGASYLSFSGGLLIPKPAGLEGALTVRRLRLRVEGDESQPRVKIDGFFLRLRNSSLLVEAGGYYSEREESGTSLSEFGFTGTVKFKVGKREHLLGVDLIHGHRSSGTESFDYLMAQAVYAGQLGPIGGVELRGARLLYASNMLPKLRELDRESRELRYYRWYLDTDPLTVPGDRRLAGWQATGDSWAFGVGASGSFVALGRLVVLDLFVLGLHGPTERGLLVSARVFAMCNTKPIGFLAIEWDQHNDRVSAVLAVDATLDKFMKDAPAWLAGAGGLQGTLFVSNDPATLAIGRLADQATWLAMRFDVDLWLKASLSIAFCLEIVENGPKGFALAVRVEGGIGKTGVVRLTYNAGWGIEVLVFTTGSSDYAAILFIEAGIRFVLFGFLRIGVSSRMEFRLVGAHPSRGELTAEIRLETPWFLPDVTWRLDVQFGELAPAALSTASPPLAGVGTTEAGSQQRLPAHVERFDPAWDGTGVAPVHSVDELRAPTRPEAERLASLAADAALRPVATDATIAVEWSVPVNDRLGLGVGLAPDLGNQQSGDLTLTYDLVGIAARRRARFGADRSWKPLEERIELGLDFSDPGGVQLDGSFGPQVLNKTWDLDMQVAGQPAPKKLLLNGIAPYEFTSADAQAAEELVRFSRDWPCCRRPDDKDLFELFHRVHWRDALAGMDLPGGSRFSDSTSTFRFMRVAWTHVAGYTGVVPNTIVAAARIDAPGVLARADLDEDAAFCSVRLAWPRGVRALLVMFDRTGKEVGRRDLGLGNAAFQGVLAGARGPIRRLELWMLPRQLPGVVAPAASSQPGTFVEVEEAAYVGLRDYLDLLLAQAACDGGASGGYGGKGKLALLPNHEYELRFTTRVSVAHPSTAAESADVDEFVYVRTKGLPGLNAVQRTGEELEPYVREAYAGGRGGVVYREEPVTLAFSEDFIVAVPLTVRPPGTAEERTTLLRMQLVVEPDVATTAGTVFTTTGDDWVATHHGAGVPPPPPRPLPPWTGVPSRAATASTAMVTANPLRHRLATVTQRAGVPCGPGDPRDVIGTVLVAPPQGNGDLWSAGARFAARVRAEGAGFVDRRPFEEGDDTAFSVTGTGTWTVSGGTLEAEGTGMAVFGEPDWDHLTVLAGIAPGSGPAGVGFGVTAPGAAPRGLFVTVEASRLVIRRRDANGGPLAELAAADLPPGDLNARVVLQATAYDDRVRAAVGEVVIEADRDEVREGRLCLVADGSAAFASLQVRGLDLYAFPFAVSRFRSFGDHVGSWSGRLDIAAPDALGPGSTTATVGGLWASGAADVTAAMAPGAPAAERERVFAAWTAALGLPLKDDVTALELTRVTDGDRTQALLIESPEPLDFTGEVTVGLVFRKHVGGLPPVHPVPPLPPGPIRSLRDRLEALVATPLRPVQPRLRLPGVDETILDVEVLPAGLRLTLHPALANAGELAVAAVDEGGTAQLFRGLVRPGFLPGQPALMLAHPEGPLPALPRGSELLPELAGAVPDTVLLAARDLLALLGRFHIQPGDVDVPVPVQVLQSGDARRALVIPADGGPFEAGRHRLTLHLSRRRWPTTDPADDVNAYQGEATVPLDL